MSRLDALGWNAGLAAAFAAVPLPRNVPFLEPARVSEEHRDALRVLTDRDDLVADCAGRLRHHAASALELPAVGDWVAVAARPHEGRATVHAVLPRSGALVRKAAGTRTVPQVLAANVHVVFVVTSCNADLNPRRIERALVTVWDGGAQPVVVLNKADLAPDADALAATLAAELPGAEVHAVSAADGRGVAALAAHCVPGRTLALLGSSGVGKSTLANRLLGAELLATGGIREADARGRHTTTSRHLVLLPSGAALIDTPGLREIALWAGETDVGDAFEDVEELAAACRFSDCRHATEPGCAVRAAIDAGELDAERLESSRKLARELRRAAAKQDAHVARQIAQEFRTRGREIRAFLDAKRRYGHNDPMGGEA